MRTVFNIILTFIFFLSQAQTGGTKLPVSDTKREFRNQGEQEDYWAEQLFKKNYSKQTFDKYKGSVTVSGDNYIYSDQVFVVFSIAEELKSIFSKGLFYPSIILGDNVSDTLTISNFQELKFVRTAPKQKRFKFLLFTKGRANPQACFIELTNPEATDATGIKTFIEGSSLTFFKTGWIMI